MNRFSYILVGLAILAWIPAAEAGPFEKGADHFVQGELRAGLAWDNMSAMETGVLKFGGTAGVFVVNGLELGFEQRFIVPPNSEFEEHTWLYLRAVPFRNWPITPFVSFRAGYLHQEDSPVGTAAVGGGVGAVMFIDEYFAFEASIFHERTLDPRGISRRATEIDWRLVVYY